MKIAVIGVKKIPANQGEIERYCQELYPRIAARGHQVDLFVQSKQHRKSSFSVYYYHNVRVITLASFARQEVTFLIDSALSTVWASLGNYDVIHIQGMKAGWFSWFPQLFSTAKVVVTSHQLDCEKTRWRKTFRWLLPWIEKTTVKNADELVVTSKALGEYFQHKYHIQPRYIPNAPGHYSQTNQEFNYGRSLGLKPQRYLLYLGQLSPEKQPDLLLKAFQKLQPLGWKLVLAGEIGSSLHYVMGLLSLAKKNDNIIFTNEIRGKHLAEIISHAGMLVTVASSSDLGLPLRVLEAMREGVPILANDQLVYQELLGKNRGLLFESGNLDSLVSKLNYAISEPLELMTIAHKAQNHIVINHNWDRVTYGNLSLYLKMTAKIPPQGNSYKAIDNPQHKF